MQTSPDDTPATSDPPAADAVGHRVGGGMTWMMIATLVARSATFLSQIVVGLWLSARELGLYSTAVAISGFLTVCREAGTGSILLHKGREGYERHAGQAFWMGLTYNAVILGVTCVLAKPIADLYKAEGLAWMLVVLSAALLPNAVSNVLYTKLRLELRFKAASVLLTISGIARQVSLMLFVILGMRHMSFAWSAVVCCVVDAACVWWVTRDALWLRPPNIAKWGLWFGSSLWLMLASLGNFGVDYAPFLVLGWILEGDNPIIGYYSFAYNITAQVGVLLAFNSMLVLTPVFQRLASEPRRQVDAAMRALRSLMLAGCVATMGTAAVFTPLEHLIFQGKFAESAAPLILLGLFYPWRITIGVTSSLLNANGSFSRLTILTLVECIGLFLVSAAAGLSSPSPGGIALWTGGWVMFIRIVSTVMVFRPLGMSVLGTLRALLPAWTICAAALGATLLLSRHFAVNDVILAWCETHLPLPAPWNARAADLAGIAAHGLFCGSLMYALIRSLLHAHLLDLLAVAPPRVRPLLQRLLLLREPVAADRQP